jgi:predicted MFS family arabinose efflux permease
LAATGFTHFAPAVLSPFLIDEFDWDRWQIGALITAFSLTGAAGSPALGRYADRIGGRNSLMLVYGANLAGLVMLAAAPGFPTLLGVMLLAGFAASAANPATNILIATHVTPVRRGAVTGIKQAGGPVGISLLGLLPVLAGAIGWRWAVLVGASFPLAGLLAVAATLPADTRQAAVDTEVQSVKGMPLVRWLAVQGLLLGAGSAAVLSFLPLYSEEVIGFSAGTAGAAVTVIGVTGIIGRVVWGWQRGRFDHVGTPLTVITVVAVSTPVWFWAAAEVSPALLWIGAALGGATFMAWNVFSMLAVIEAVPRALAGRASGDVTLGFLAGFTVSPILFGLLVDASGTYNWGWVAIGITFVAAALTTPAVARALSE